MRLISALLFASTTLLAMEASAQARIFCCDDKDGRKVCGDFLPKECQGRAYEERDGKGFVSKKVEAPLTAEQQARRVAEMAKQEEAKKKAVEDRRRTLALLSTYSSPKDVDTARDRALAEIEKNMKESQTRLDEALKVKKKLDGEKEFYKGKALPANIKSQLAENEAAVKGQEALIAGKKKEMDEVRAKFADEKKRYIELTGKTADATGAAAKPAAVPIPAAPAPAAEAPKPAAKPAEKPAEKK
jgi:hypothetical protein